MWWLWIIISFLASVKIMFCDVGNFSESQDHIIHVNFMTVDADGNENALQISFERNYPNVSDLVVRTCKDNQISSRECKNLFRQTIISQINANSSLTWQEVIQSFKHFAISCTQLLPPIFNTKVLSKDDGNNTGHVDEITMDSILQSEFNYFPKTSIVATTKLLLCVSHFQENLMWLQTTNVPFIVVSKTLQEQDKVLHIPVNRGNEVSSYLKYIVDYYEVLPEFTLFLHGHDTDWHQYYSVAYIIQQLELRKGYENINNIVVDDLGDKIYLGRLHELWDQLFLEELGPIPESGFHGKCCAQFVVHRDQIRNHPRQFYQRLYDFVVSDQQDDAAFGDGYHASMSYVMEIIWHYIFGDSAFEQYAKDDNFQLSSFSPVFDQAIKIYL